MIAYHPKYRPPELLALTLKAAGAQVIDKDGKRDFLVYSALPERMRRLGELLEQLDQPTPSVLVKAALIVSDFVPNTNYQRNRFPDHGKA